jgi:hypothetical protein
VRQNERGRKEEKLREGCGEEVTRGRIRQTESDITEGAKDKADQHTYELDRDSTIYRLQQCLPLFFKPYDFSATFLGDILYPVRNTPRTFTGTKPISSAKHRTQ